jgi:hypothetical protein
LSVATGITQVATAQESKVVKVILDGQNGNLGLMVSLAQGFVMETKNEHVAVLLFWSVAVYVTVVEPCLKHVFGSFDAKTVGVPQLSVAVGAVQLTNVHESMLTKLMVAGQRDRSARIRGLIGNRYRK